MSNIHVVIVVLLPFQISLEEFGMIIVKCSFEKSRLGTLHWYVLLHTCNCEWSCI